MFLAQKLAHLYYNIFCSGMQGQKTTFSVVFCKREEEMKKTDASYRSVKSIRFAFLAAKAGGKALNGYLCQV